MERIGIVAGSSIALSSMPWISVFTDTTNRRKSSYDHVRLAVIGTGGRGRTLIQNILVAREYENVDIVAVCDDYPPHLNDALQLTNGCARGYSDYCKLLDSEDIDGVLIATPLHLHASITIDALEAGVHVFCEKSMARSLDDVKRMYDTHVRTGKILVVGHQRLFSPVYLEAIKRIHEGEIGPITQLRGCWHRNRIWRRKLNQNAMAVWERIPAGCWDDDWSGRTDRPLREIDPVLDRRLNWRLYDEYSAGLITELGSHHFQVANWILRSQPSSVIGSGGIVFWKDGREVYDNFACIFKYPDEVHLLYDCSSSNKYNGAQLQVLGTTGTMELESNKKYSEDPPPPPAIRRLIHTIEKDLFETIPIGGATWVPETPLSYEGEYLSADYKMNETRLFIEGFIKYIRQNNAPEELLKEAYRSAVWSLLAEQAIKTGTEITLPEGFSI
jgi:predicted dehydrogenase